MDDHGTTGDEGGVWGGAEAALRRLYPARYDEAMNACRRLAHEIYGAHLGHEQVARHVAGFLRERLSERPPSAETEALVSVVNACEATATYMSSGSKAIRLSLATLLRLAGPYSDHADFDRAWTP
jgi:hypothetical protein